MERYNNEALIKDSNLEPIDFLYNACKSLCKIEIYQKIGTGFFLKTEKGNKTFYCLISCEHVISENNINNKVRMGIYYDTDNKNLQINLDSQKRFIRNYKYLGLDATVVQILEEDKINEAFFLSFNIDFLNNFENLKKKKIYILQFPLGRNLNKSEGEIKSIDKYSKEFSYSASTKNGSSGSPIFLEGTSSIIGIHKKTSLKYEENYGNFIGPIINSLKEDLSFAEFYENIGDYVGDKIFAGEYLEKNGIIEKYGKYFYNNGMYYIGHLIGNKEYGEGIIYYNNNSIYYEGEFVNGKKEGKGKIYKKDNTLEYEGDFKNDQKTGKGTLYNKLLYYDGELLNGIPNGKGSCLIYKDSISYEGEFINGEFEGNGRIILSSGNYYIGQFHKNKKHGKGILFSSDKKILYEGDFIDDKYDGEGTKLLDNAGNYYIGDFKKGERNGHGVIFDKNNNIIIEGFFFNDKLEGNFRYFKGKKIYVGDCKNGKIKYFKKF